MYKYNYEVRLFEPKQFPILKMNYIIALPSDYKEGEQLPMLVFLHGAGERGTNPELIRVHGVPKYLETGLPVRAVILAPQIPDECHVWNNLTDETMELIENIATEYTVDRDRISLTGISMGGYGTWEMALANPEYFSAIAPVCGGAMSWRANLLTNMPIRTVHGDVDSCVPINNTLEMVDAINANGGDAACIILHNINHDSWNFAYEQTNLIEWLVKQDRKNRENKNFNSWTF